MAERQNHGGFPIWAWGQFFARVIGPHVQGNTREHGPGAPCNGSNRRATQTAESTHAEPLPAQHLAPPAQPRSPALGTIDASQHSSIAPTYITPKCVRHLGTRAAPRRSPQTGAAPVSIAPLHSACICAAPGRFERTISPRSYKLISNAILFDSAVPAALERLTRQRHSSRIHASGSPAVCE